MMEAVVEGRVSFTFGPAFQVECNLIKPSGSHQLSSPNTNPAPSRKSSVIASHLKDAKTTTRRSQLPSNITVQSTSNKNAKQEVKALRGQSLLRFCATSMVCNHPVGRESKRPRVISEKLSLKMPLPSPKKDDIVPIGNGIPMAFKKSKLRAHRPSKQANTTTSSPGTMGTDPSVGHREGSQSNSNTPSCHSSESLGAKETSSVASTDTGERPPLNLRDKRATERVLRKAPYQKHLNQLGATLKYALFKIQNGWEDKPLDEVKQCYAQRNPSRPGTSVSFHVENGRACIVGNPTPKHMYRPLAKIKGDELFLQREGRRSSDQDMAEAALALQFLSGGGSLPPSSLPSSGTVANTAGTSRRADGSSRKRPSEDTVTPQPPRKIRRNNIGVLTPTPTPTAKTTPQSTKFTKYVACAQQPSTPQSCSGMSTAIGNIKHTCFSYYSVSPSCRALTHEPFYAPPLPYAYTIPSLCQPSPVIKSTLPE